VVKYILEGREIMEDKSFELLTKMYSEMTEQFKEKNGKLDKKANKSDIMIVPQKAVLRLFTAGLSAVSCNFVATWCNLIWLSSLL